MLYHVKIQLQKTVTLKEMDWHEFNIQVYDKDLISHDFLGHAIPNKGGEAIVAFHSSALKSLDSPTEELPDVFFKVLLKEKLIYQSPWLKDVATLTHPMSGFSTETGIVIDMGTYLLGKDGGISARTIEQLEC